MNGVDGMCLSSSLHHSSMNDVLFLGITIGNNVTIGAGAVVIKDILDGATDMGVPGRIFKR